VVGWNIGGCSLRRLRELRADHFDEDKISTGWKSVRFCLITYLSVGIWQTVNHDRKPSEGAALQGGIDERKNS
jgi:hypothetical protein